MTRYNSLVYHAYDLTPAKKALTTLMCMKGVNLAEPNTPDNSSPDVSELQAIIKRMEGDQKALVGEFTDSLGNGDKTVSDIEKAVDEAAVAAIRSIVNIAERGDTESLMLAASKYLVDTKLKLQAAKGSSDNAIKELIKAITTSDTASASSSGGHA